jgi:hypothetical protein
VFFHASTGRKSPLPPQQRRIFSEVCTLRNGLTSCFRTAWGTTEDPCGGFRSDTQSKGREQGVNFISEYLLNREIRITCNFGRHMLLTGPIVEISLNRKIIGIELRIKQ